MNICIIANGYPDRRDPQAGNFEKDQALALQQLGHQVSVLYVDSRLRWYKRKIGITNISDNGLKVYGIYVFPFNILTIIPYSSRFTCWVKSILMQRLFTHMLKECGQPDVFYAHFMGNIAVGAYLKKKNSIPLVGIEHWSVLMRDKLTSGQKYTGQRGYKNCDRLLAVSEALRKGIKRHFGIESIVVQNLVGQEFFQKATISKRNDIIKDIFPNDIQLSNSFFFLTVGSLKHIKGYDIMLEAFARAHLSEQGCKIVMIGEGEEHRYLQKRIQALKLDKAIVMVGRKCKDEIINIMSICNAFVLSSRSETFSVACIEALSQGLPCIATACGGPQEILTKEDGILIPPENIDAMRDAMLKMYENYSKYNKKLIAENCAKRFAPQVVAAKLTNVFLETINNQIK